MREIMVKVFPYGVSIMHRLKAVDSLTRPYKTEINSGFTDAVENNTNHCIRTQGSSAK